MIKFIYKRKEYHVESMPGEHASVDVDEALQKCEDLQASNAEYLKRAEEAEAELAKHEWVSVEDDMPDPNNVDDWEVQLFDIEGVCLTNISVSFTNDIPSYYNQGDEFTLEDIKRTYTHWKPITLPEPKKAKVCLMPAEMIKHHFEHCESDNPTANCLRCENWKMGNATFLPECKWQRQERNVTMCHNVHSVHVNQPCSKRCKNPEKETKPAAPAARNRPSLDLKRRG